MRLQDVVHRPRYEKLIKSYRGSRDIKVITGVRRCGKSTLLRMVANDVSDELRAPQNIFYRRMDSFDVPLNPDAPWLEGELLEAMKRADRDKPFYVFIDEVQEVQDWEKVIRRLHTQDGVDVYITGSNAHVLSSDLSTLLGGRYAEIPVHPLSFSEYLVFCEKVGMSFPDRAVQFAEYVKYGGMPGQFDVAERNEASLARFLQTINDTIILNDVAMHAQIGDMDLLAKLVRYVFSTSGSLFSTRSIVNTLTSSGRKTTSETVDNYLAALRDTFILRACEQVGVAGKQVLRPLRKLYPVDTGLRNLSTGFAPKDFGAQLECAVHNELVRRGYSVKVGMLQRGEIDFVAERSSEKLYIQVTESLIAPETYERELRPFSLIKDAFPKIVLVGDAFRLGTTEDGVQIANICDWLLDAEG